MDFLRETLGDAAARGADLRLRQRERELRERVSATSVALEDFGVAAYNGQATNLTSDALAAAAQIVSVHARHAAWIRSIVGKTPAIQATDRPKTQAQVEAALEATGFLRAPVRSKIIQTGCYSIIFPHH